MLGNTIEQAAGAKLRKVAADSKDLRELAGHLQDAMLADLGDAAQALAQEIGNAAAVAADVTLLMQTLPSLANADPLRQRAADRRGDGPPHRRRHRPAHHRRPRRRRREPQRRRGRRDGAAHPRDARRRSSCSKSESHTKDWHDALARTLPHDSIHGLVRGRAARLLLDAGRIDAAEVARLLSLTLSRGADPSQGARWLEGFLSGSGLLLIHDAKLLSLIDGWVAHIQPEIFEELVPLLRRTFSTFPAPERKQIGQMLSKGVSQPSGRGDPAGVRHQPRTRRPRAAAADADPRRQGMSVTTLVLPPRVTEDSDLLARAARRAGWDVERLPSWHVPPLLRDEDVVLYAEPLFVLHAGPQLDVTVLETPYDWLPKLPRKYVRRAVRLTTLREARSLVGDWFVKPAMEKFFRAVRRTRR